MNVAPARALQELLNQILATCNACLEKNDHDSAWRALSAAVAIFPDNPAILAFRGQLALVRMDLETAQHDFDRALKIDPNHASAQAGLARYEQLKAHRPAPDSIVGSPLKQSTTDCGLVGDTSVERHPFKLASARSKADLGLAVVVERGFRRQPLLVDSVRHWSQTRGVPVSVIDHDAFHSGDWGLPADRIGAFYLPITERYDPVDNIPRQYPVIVDFDANGSSNITTVDFKGLRYAVRNAFGMRVAANHPPEFQVPYLHRACPMDSSDVRNVVIFDVKTFHGLPAQAAALALIAGVAEEYERICTLAGRRVFLYFSSFMPAAVFMDAIEAFVREPVVTKITRNVLRDVASAIIPPAASMAEYKTILGRCRLFVTEHGDLADIDLIQLGAIGVPIMLYQRLPFFKTAGISLQTIRGAEAVDSRIVDLLRKAERQRVRPEWGMDRIFSHDRAEPWDVGILDDIYMKTWDLLWRWAIDGIVDQAVNEAMNTDFQWRLGLVAEAAS